MTQPYTQILSQAVLVVAVLVLLYCLYVVQDWLDMLTHDQVQLASPQKFTNSPLLTPFINALRNQGVKKKLAAMDPSGRGRRGEPGAGAPSTVSPTSQPGRTMEVTANSTSTTLASPAHLPPSLAPQVLCKAIQTLAYPAGDLTETL